jgi:hypothetical protein
MMTTVTTTGGATIPAAAIETRRSWLVARTALAILTVSFGPPLITIVALKAIAAEYDNVRSVPTLSYSLAWFGSAAGVMATGRIAERTGARWTVMFGALMVAGGLFPASVGGRASLSIGHGVLPPESSSTLPIPGRLPAGVSAKAGAVRRRLWKRRRAVMGIDPST